MQKITLTDLITKTRDVIRSRQYSSSTLSLYDGAWKGLCEYFSSRQTHWFSKDMAIEYLSTVESAYQAGQAKASYYSRIRKSVMMLIECYETGDVKWRKITPDSALTTNQGFLDIVNHYCYYLMKQDYSQGTIDIRKTVFRKFLVFIQQTGLAKISEVHQDTINHFILYASKSYQAGSMGTVFSAMRSFLAFLYGEKLISIDMSPVVPVDFRRKTSIIPVITQDEEKKLLQVLDTTSLKGKRDYAILLLALRLGLRSIDIIQLRVIDINWRQQTIEINQQKTGRQLILPLLPEVGNALMDYLLHGRPASKEPYVFLRSLAPYTKLADSSSLYNIVSNLMKKAGVRQQPGDRKGAHCLRHTLGSRLLNAETPLPIISGILGHQDKNATKDYLSTDLEHLRACALDMTGIEVTGEVWQ